MTYYTVACVSRLGATRHYSVNFTGEETEAHRYLCKKRAGTPPQVCPTSNALPSVLYESPHGRESLYLHPGMQPALQSERPRAAPAQTCSWGGNLMEVWEFQNQSILELERTLIREEHNGS